MRWLPFSWLFVVLVGGVAGWSLGGLGSSWQDAGLHEQPYRLLRSDADPYLLTPAKWLLEPHRYGDFDLHMTLELGEKAAVDVLLRQVEPRIVRDELRPFHGRFCVLRMSTAGAGPAWLSRDAALFGERMLGHELAPGMPATVWVQARGRMLRANIAGKWLPWFEADDEYGMLTVIARGGDAVLRQLVIEPQRTARPWLHERTTWLAFGACVGLTLGALAWSLLRSPMRLLAAAAVLLCGVLSSVGGARVPPLAFASPGGQLAVLGAWSLLAAGVVLWPRRKPPGEVAAIVVALVLSVAALLHQAGMHRLANQGPPQHEQRLHDVFGPRAGNSIAEALAQRVRGNYAVNSVGPEARCVFLLGGQLLYNRSSPEQHLQPLLMGQLRGGLAEKIEVPCLPTVDGHAQQQWRMFAEFFTGYRPAALVFGVGRDEAVIDPQTARPRSDAAALRATLRAAATYAAANQCQLVLFTEQGLADELLVELEQLAAAGTPLVIAAATDTPEEIARKLAAALLPQLRR